MNQSSEQPKFLNSKPFTNIPDIKFNEFLSNYGNIEELLQLKEVIQKSPLDPKEGLKPTIGKFQVLSQLIESTYGFNFQLQSVMMDKYALLSEDIFKYRSIKGDGNCFYRAVIFSFVEQIILNGELNLLKNFIYEFNECFKLQELKNYNLKYDLALKIFVIIYIAIKKNKIAEGYNLFFRSFLNCAHFELSLILFFRFILKRFIMENTDKLYSTEFQVKLGNLLPQNYETEKGEFLFDKFYQEYLMQMGRDAEAIIVHVASYVLCIHIDIIMFDAEGDQRKNFDFVGESNFKKNCNIALLNRKEHYELIYTKEYYGMYYQIFQNYTAESYQNQILTDIKNTGKYENVNLLRMDSGNQSVNLLSFSTNNIGMNNTQPMTNQPMTNQPMPNNQLMNNPQINTQPMNNQPMSNIQLMNNSSINTQPMNPNNSQNIPSNPNPSPLIKGLCVVCQRNTPIQKFGITSVCQFCLINEIKIQMNSIYHKCIDSLKQKYLSATRQEDYCRMYIQIFNNEKITLPKSYRTYEIEEIIKFANTFLPENNKLNTNQIFISLKKIYCSNCYKNINATQQMNPQTMRIKLPCDCNFCSIDCMKDFLYKTMKIETKMMSKNLFCFCTMNYEHFQILDMIFLSQRIKDNKMRHIFSTIFRNMTMDKCAICQRVIKTTGSAPNYVKCTNREDRNWQIFGDNYYLNHALCFNCYQLGTLKDFFCRFCNTQHQVLKEIPPQAEAIF